MAWGYFERKIIGVFGNRVIVRSSCIQSLEILYFASPFFLLKGAGVYRLPIEGYCLARIS